MVAEVCEKAGIRDQKKEERFQSIHGIPKSATVIKFLIILTKIISKLQVLF